MKWNVSIFIFLCSKLLFLLQLKSDTQKKKTTNSCVYFHSISLFKKVHFFLITQTNQPTFSSVMWYMPGKRAKNIVSCQFTCFVQPAAKKINTSCSLGAAADDDGICCMVHCISATFSKNSNPHHHINISTIVYYIHTQDKTKLHPYLLSLQLTSLLMKMTVR